MSKGEHAEADSPRQCLDRTGMIRAGLECQGLGLIGVWSLVRAWVLLKKLPDALLLLTAAAAPTIDNHVTLRLFILRGTVEVAASVFTLSAAKILVVTGTVVLSILA